MKINQQTIFFKIPNIQNVNITDKKIVGSRKVSLNHAKNNMHVMAILFNFFQNIYSRVNVLLGVYMYLQLKSMTCVHRPVVCVHMACTSSPKLVYFPSSKSILFVFEPRAGKGSSV